MSCPVSKIPREGPHTKKKDLTPRGQINARGEKCGLLWAGCVEEAASLVYSILTCLNTYEHACFGQTCLDADKELT